MSEEDTGRARSPHAQAGTCGAGPGPTELTVRRLLDERAAALDGATRSRLRQARARAVDLGAAPRGPMALVEHARSALSVSVAGAALAVAGSLLILPGLLQHGDLPTAPEAVQLAVDAGSASMAVEAGEGVPVDELEIVLAGDSIEMLEDLEFYEWLAAQSLI